MTIFDKLAELRYRNPLLYRVGFIHIITFFLLLIPFLLDNREVLGINTWIKPMKFALSIGIYCWTIGWIMFDLPKSKKWIISISRLIATSMIIEMSVILYQASRATASHFNTETAFDAILFGIMGLMIVLNTLAVVTILFLFVLKKSKLERLYLLAIRIGLIIFLVSNYIGKVMIDQMAHSVGVRDGGKGIPFLNWSMEGGDVRISHFLGLHSIQIIPLFVYFLKEKTSLKASAQTWILIGFIIVYTSLFSFLYFEAMKGVPLFSK